MHRSGTSAATRLVNLLGIPTCVEDDLLRGTEDNPRGYWESGSLTAFNDRILETFESDWSCPPRLDPGWEADPLLAELRSEASALFSRVFPAAPWVWKDPRNCVTLPFWTESLDVEPVVVLVHRNPLEITASLGARDDLGKLYSLALWERYLQACLTAASGLPAFVTTYDEILENPAAWCDGVRDLLDGVGIGTGELEPNALDYVDSKLRHAALTHEDAVGDPAVSSAQRELLGVIEGLRGAHNALSVPGLPDETPTTEALLAERRRGYPREREHRELGEYSRSLGEQFVELQRYSEGLGNQFVEQQRYSEGLANQFVELQRNSEELWAQFQELQRYSDDLGQRFVALEKYARELQGRSPTG